MSPSDTAIIISYLTYVCTSTDATSDVPTNSTRSSSQHKPCDATVAAICSSDVHGRTLLFLTFGASQKGSVGWRWWLWMALLRGGFLASCTPCAWIAVVGGVFGGGRGCENLAGVAPRATRLLGFAAHFSRTSVIPEVWEGLLILDGACAWCLVAACVWCWGWAWFAQESHAWKGKGLAI